MKRIVVALLFVALIGSGAFAQLMFGVTGDLHMDTQLTSTEILDKFQRSDGIFYGPFVEIVFGNLGIGVAGTFSFWNDSAVATDFMTYDVDAYLSYHLWGGHAFLDPFGELGVGYIAYDYANSAENPDTNNPKGASVFWYGALGLGINLGPIGVFGKFAYNAALPYQLDAVDSSGNKLGYKVPYYGTFDPATGKITEYVPAARVTFGAKLIL